jgi:hypothetical protein
MDTVVRWQAVTSAPIRSASPVSAADAFADHHPELPLLKSGTVLEAGGVYLDLAHPIRGPFRALAGQVAGTGNRYVAQRDVSCDLWCTLIKSAAASAFGGLQDVDCDDLEKYGGLVPWPAAHNTVPAEMAAP